MPAARRASIPRATYRLQLHKDFDFAAARAVLPYLHQLGISHVYCSPIGTAQPGSRHGYDVVDPSRINPELGGRAGFEAFASAARDLGIGLLLDVVPNHMGIAGGRNAWWLDVLESGQASAFAHVFDIEWHGPNACLAGKVMSPVLAEPFGTVLDRGGITLAFEADRGGFAMRYESQRFPIDPRSYAQVLGSATHPTLQALSVAFGALPAHDAGDSQDRSRRQAELPGLQRALGDAARTVAVADEIDACLARFSDAGNRDALDALHEGQAFRLAYWRSALDDINYRRFFDVNELAAIRVEDESVFEATQGLALDLAAAGWVDGLRVDHPDGLRDPARYLLRLQQAYLRRLGRTESEAPDRPLYVVVEKIEALDERLPADWAVYGTTGYRFAALLGGLFVETRHARSMERAWRKFRGSSEAEPSGLDRIVRDARREIARGALSAPLTSLAHRLRRIAAADRHTRDHGFNALRDALAEVVAAMQVYRTYLVANRVPGAQDRRGIDAAVERAVRSRHSSDVALFEFVRHSLLGEAVPGASLDLARQVVEFAVRFQQFSAPVAARGVEDTAFYRYLRLLSLNEVGGDPGHFGTSTSAFHAANLRRAKDWPHTMLATSTHDNKRAEDVRWRLSVLSERPREWRLALRRWRAATHAWGGDAPTPDERFLLLQTLLGTLPAQGLGAETLPGYRDRIEHYMVKAAREAKLHTTWADPNPAHEQPLVAFVRQVLAGVDGNSLLADLQAEASSLAWHGALNGLAATLLKFTLPGVPDLYQGTEVVDLSLVDPDNRRPVDYALRMARLAELQAVAAAPDPQAELTRWAAAPTDGRLKMWLIWRLLGWRRAQPLFFEAAGYEPLRVGGARRRHVVAFARRHGGSAAIVIAGLKFAGMRLPLGQRPVGSDVWSDTSVELPAWAGGASEAVDELTGASRKIDAVDLRLADVFSVMPFAALRIGATRAH